MTSQSGEESWFRRRPNSSARTGQNDVSRLDPGDSTPEAGYFNASSLSSAFSKFFGRFCLGWRTRRGGDIEDLRDNDEGPSSSNGSPSRNYSAEDKRGKNAYKVLPANGSDKLGTFSGVFVPTTLNVLSILMFLRFGFILGQGGVLGIMGEYFHIQ